MLVLIPRIVPSNVPNRKEIDNDGIGRKIQLLRRIAMNFLDLILIIKVHESS